MESDKQTVICTVIATDQSSFSYKACSNCETINMPDNPPPPFCSRCKDRPYRSRRFFRLFFSIATDTKVVNVVCFDKAAKVIFGCSAQEFFDFAACHPFAVKNACHALVGEMLQVTLTKPKVGKADHLRMTAIVPLRSDFQPVIQTLKELYQVSNGAKPT